MVRTAVVALLAACACASTSSGWPEPTFRVELGETALVQAEFERDRAVSITRIPDPEFDSRTFTFRLTDESEAGKTMLMLAARNQLDRPVKYDLSMELPDGRSFYTSSCPLHPGKWVFEGWPHAISAITVSNMRFVSADYRTCE